MHYLRVCKLRTARPRTVRCAWRRVSSLTDVHEPTRWPSLRVLDARTPPYHGHDLTVPA